MSTSVKHIHSGMRGVPALSGAVGALLPVIDTHFLSGHGASSALSVSVSGGVATAEFASGLGFERDVVVLVSGATPPELNGEARVLSAGTSGGNPTITFATGASDGVATGSISVKYAPQSSWEKIFSKTNVSAYKSNYVTSNGHAYRLDDTSTQRTKVRGYESMSDVDTGFGPFPTDAQSSGGGEFWKSLSSSADTTVQWRAFSDERFFILAVAASSTREAKSLRGFGDLIPIAPGGDVWTSAVSYQGSSSTAMGSGGFSGGAASGTSGALVTAKGFAGLGGSAMSHVQPYVGLQNTISGNDGSLGVLPSTVDGQIKMSSLYIADTTAGSPPRAVIPGVYYIPQSGATSYLAEGDILDGAGPLAGRRLMCIAVGTSYGAAHSGITLVDLTGPWR